MNAEAGPDSAVPVLYRQEELIAYALRRAAWEAGFAQADVSITAADLEERDW
jgi:hypothetical protein